MTKKGFNIQKDTPVKTTVGAIIVKNNKILLEKRATDKEKNKWCLPGGHIDIGETALYAVKREVKEETGFSLKNIKFINYYDEYTPRLKTHAVSLIFTGTVSGKQNLQKSEVSEIKWFSKRELTKIKIAFKHRNIINKFAEGLK